MSETVPTERHRTSQTVPTDSAHRQCPQNVETVPTERHRTSQTVPSDSAPRQCPQNVIERQRQCPQNVTERAPRQCPHNVRDQPHGPAWRTSPLSLSAIDLTSGPDSESMAVGQSKQSLQSSRTINILNINPAPREMFMVTGKPTLTLRISYT